MENKNFSIASSEIQHFWTYYIRTLESREKLLEFYFKAIAFIGTLVAVLNFAARIESVKSIFLITN